MQLFVDDSKKNHRLQQRWEAMLEQKQKGWSHRESNTGRSRIFVGLTKSDEPQATVIPLHYRTSGGNRLH
jgi:hypothetical protein